MTYRPALIALALLACSPAGPTYGVPPAVAFPAPALPPQSAAPPASPADAPAPAPLEATRNVLPSGTFAVSSAISVERVAPDGSWMVVCQARSDSDGNGVVEVRVGPRGELSGDVLERSLIFAHGIEHPVDDWLTASDDGRSIIVSQAGKLFTFTAGQRFPLELPGGDTRTEPGSRSTHRTLALFGESLVYVRERRARFEVVQRDLATGAEHVVYTGAEPIVRLASYDNGERLLMSVGVDTNGNGRFDWPFVPRSAPRPCGGPISRFLAPRLSADGLSAVLLDRRTNTARRVDDLVLPFGTGFLRRLPDGAIVLERDGVTRSVGDKTCAGRILWTDPQRDQLLLGCAVPKKPGRLLVEWVGGLGRATLQRLPLDIDVAALAMDEAGDGHRLVALYPGADTTLFDLDRQKLHRLRPGDAVLRTSGSLALVRRARTLFVFDVETAQERELASGVDPFGPLLVQGDVVYASPFIADARTGELIGEVTGAAQAVTSFGAVLLATAPAHATALAQGPLRWQMPLPVGGTDESAGASLR